MGLLDPDFAQDPNRMGLLMAGLTTLANYRNPNAIAMGLNQYNTFREMSRREAETAQEKAYRKQQMDMQAQQFSWQQQEQQRKQEEAAAARESMGRLLGGKEAYIDTKEVPYTFEQKVPAPTAPGAVAPNFGLLTEQATGTRQEQAFNQQRYNQDLLNAGFGDKLIERQLAGSQPIKLGKGERLIDPNTRQELVGAVQDPADLPAAVLEYQYAQSQGYNGSFNDWNLEGKRAGATNIGLPKIEVKMGESVASQVGPILKESRTSAVAGAKMVESSNRILQGAQSGNLIAGPMANTRLKAAQVYNWLGGRDPSVEKRIANTRQVVQGLAEQSVAARSQLGGQAQISNSEQELLNKATSGSIDELTAGEIVQLANLNKRLGRQLYDTHQQQLQNMQGDPNLQGMVKFYSVPKLADEPKVKGGFKLLGVE